jgi:hypothetical protein
MGGPCTVDGVERKELDNFYACLFKIDGLLWSSSEQYYQAGKCPDDEDQRERIRTGDTGMGCWSIGQEVRAREDWEEVKVDMMYTANKAKFSQNPDLRNVLVRSQGKIHAQGGLFWKTWNEILLERIREELRDFHMRDFKVLAHRKAAMEAYRIAARARDEYAVEVATKYASHRLPIPTGESGDSVIVKGGGKEVDGVYQIDLKNPEANGRPHYICSAGMHLYLGQKRGEQAWVIDEVFDPEEKCGLAFLLAGQDCDVPFGARVWQFFDGTKHSDRTLAIRCQ